MQKNNSLRPFQSRELLSENKRISDIIMRSRVSLSPAKKSRKDDQNEEAQPFEVIFPLKRRRYSMNADDNLKSDEFIITLRNRENLGKKLQKMKDGIRMGSESESPAKLTKVPVSVRRPSEISENTAIPFPHVELDKNMSDVLLGIRKNFTIFQTLFQSSRNKQEIVSKLHGWDDDFQELFFQNRQIRNFTIETVRSHLGLDRKTHKSRNYFNKLKLLLGELIRVNCQRQGLIAQIEKQKINDEIRQISHIERNYYSSCKGVNKHIYDNMVKQTRSKVMDMKTRIRDKNNLLKVIEEQTGGMPKIDHFFRKQEENLAHLETLLMKKNDQSTEF